MEIKFLASGQKKSSNLWNKQVQKIFQQKSHVRFFCLFIFVVCFVLLIFFFWGGRGCLFVLGFFGCPFFPLPGREAANMGTECEGSPVCFSFRYSGEQQ